MDKKAHFFYALKLPLETKQLMQEYCLKLKENFFFSRWVHHEDFHITLAFLGNAEQEQLQNSIQQVQKELQEQTTFSLVIHHLGVFGKKDSPRIFWAGVKEEKQLFRIRDLVYESCIASGFKLESRPFHPHITLARKWSGEELFSSERLEENHPFTDEPIRFQANEVVLYQTILNQIPKYEAIETFPLKGK